MSSRYRVPLLPKYIYLGVKLFILWLAIEAVVLLIHILNGGAIYV